MKRRSFIRKAGLGLTAYSVVPKLLGSANTLREPELINPGLNSMELRDHGKALINPGMGYVGYYYSHYLDMYGARLEPSDALEWFPGESTVYLRVTWAQLEPEEGKFNWSLLDTPAQRWIDAGKYCSFRVSCHETGLRFATPEWVKEAGAKGYNIDVSAPASHSRITTGEGDTWEPVYNDPVFLEKLENFIKVMAERYDNNPNVAFVDIGSFGTWGEGHTNHASKVIYPLDMYQTHIDLHTRHFKNTLLCISDDVDGNNNTSGHYPVMDYALSQGVTMRDDSIQSAPPPRSWFHGDMAQRFWPTLPVIMEHAHYRKPRDRGDWGEGEILVKAIEKYHASFLSIHHWPHEYFKDNRELIDKINRRLGYRLQILKIQYPGQVRIGEAFKMTSIWANAGVAPCYAGGYPCFTIKDDKGGIVSTHVDRGLNVKDLSVAKPGLAETVQLDSELTVAMGFREIFRGKEKLFAMTAHAGDYHLYVSVGKLDGTPILALPYDMDDGHRRYRVGSIRMEARD